MNKIVIDECEVAYSEENTGKTPVVFIHGYNSSSISFKALVNQSNRNYDMILVDLPGNGKSQTQKQLSIELYNEITEKLLAKIGRKKYVLFGHSLGGATVAYLSKNDNIIQGILAAPFNPFLHEYSSILNIKKMLKPESMSEAIISIKELVENREKKFYFDNIDSSAKSFFNFIKKTESKYSYILNDQILSRDYQMNILYNHFNVAKLKLQGIIGREDMFVPLETANKITREFGINFKVIENCGHSIVYEHPEQINDFINNIIEEIKNGNSNI